MTSTCTNPTCPSDKCQLEQAREIFRKIDAEVSGCGPNVSKDFLRLALTSIRDMARGALRRSGNQP